MFDNIDIFKLFIMLVALLVAIIGHEIMHGFVALRYGDDSAKLAGRLTINPIKHIDPIGSILVPLVLFFLNAPFLFGWAKPVPVDIREVIKNGGYNGAIAVSLAGIAYNLGVAILAALIIKSGIIPQSGLFVLIAYNLLLSLVVYNVVLAIFNLLPIPPLDGSQALGYIALKFNNASIAIFFNKIERYGIFILILILLTPLSTLIFVPMKLLINMLL